MFDRCTTYNMQQTFAALMNDWLAVKSQRRHFTPRDGAKRLSISHTTLYSWINAQRIPPPTRSAHIARVIEVPVQIVRDAIAFSHKLGKPSGFALSPTNGETP